MNDTTNEDLIEKAASVINPTKVDNYLVADVGCALITDKGNVYLGVCIEVNCSLGFCAESSAIAAMVTGGEFKINKLVAVWKNKDGMPQVIPPCGRCREFIRQIHKDNLQTDIILGKDKVVKLAELLPHYDWFN